MPKSASSLGWVQNRNAGRISAFYGSYDAVAAIPDWSEPIPKIPEKFRRLDDEQTRPPASPQAGKPTPEDPISPMQPRALHRALEGGYLLGERQVLRGERRAASGTRRQKRSLYSPCTKKSKSSLTSRAVRRR
jgi:hypothetical protein